MLYLSHLRVPSFSGQPSKHPEDITLFDSAIISLFLKNKYFAAFIQKKVSIKSVSRVSFSLCELWAYEVMGSVTWSKNRIKSDNESVFSWRIYNQKNKYKNTAYTSSVTVTLWQKWLKKIISLFSLMVWAGIKYITQPYFPLVGLWLQLKQFRGPEKKSLKCNFPKPSTIHLM